MNWRWTAAVVSVAAVAAPPLVVVVLPVAALVARNLDYFPDGQRTALPLYAVALVALAAGAGLTRWWRGPAVRFAASLYLLSAPAWFVHTLALQATGAVAVTAVVLLAWPLAAAAASRVPRDKLLGYAGTLSIPLVLAGIFPLAAAATGEPTNAVEADQLTSEPPAGEPADLPNIYHVVFDEYQTDFFEFLLDDGLRETLGGFTFYPEAITTYGRTEMSFVSMFSFEDYNYTVSPDEVLHGPLNTLSALGDLGYHRVGYLHHPRHVGADVHLDAFVRHNDLEHVAGLSGRTDLLVSLWLYAHTPEPVSRRLVPEHHHDQLVADALLPDDAPPLSVAGFRRFLDEEPDLPARGRYTLVHVILPHFPHVLDERCGWWPGQRTEPIAQSACTNRLLAELVDLLRELDRFEDSVVVVQADHGAWHERTDGEFVSTESRGHYDERASWWRARSLLLVRTPADDPAEPLRVDGRPATLDDVMPTIFDALGLDHEFRGNRYSLLGDLPPDRERFYHFYDRAEGRRIVDGPLARFRVRDDSLVFDREIDVPDPE